jgi:hypothetical protein
MTRALEKHTWKTDFFGRRQFSSAHYRNTVQTEHMLQPP